MFEREYRDLQFVPRWAIARTTRTQSVAEHSFFVALYASEILKFYHEKHPNVVALDDVAEVLRYAIVHDRTEAFMSDIPGPVKRSIRDAARAEEYERRTEVAVFGRFSEPSTFAKAVVKVADLMDEFGFWWDEGQLGNKFCDKIMPQVDKRLRQSVENLPYLLDADKVELMSAFLRGVRKDKLIPENNNDVAA